MAQDEEQGMYALLSFLSSLALYQATYISASLIHRKGKEKDASIDWHESGADLEQMLVRLGRQENDLRLRKNRGILSKRAMTRFTIMGYATETASNKRV